MACILHIETSAKICSIAVSNQGKIIFYKEELTGFAHAAFSGIFAEEAIRLPHKEKLNLDAVSISEGPGSYTGLRIGTSLAKGICYGLDIPLIALPTLKIISTALLFSGRVHSLSDSPKIFLCPMIDARRMEVYAAVYDKNLNEIHPAQAHIIDNDSFSELLCRGKVIFFGDGADKCQSVIDSPNASFVQGIYPLATSMVSLAEDAFSKQEFTDTAYFEPFYLKEFQATVPKNKII